MNAISKVSEITAQDVADYIRLDEVTASDIAMLTTYLSVARSYIVSYTGRTEADLDKFSDLVIVCLILCQDMWDNRTLYIEKGNLNKVVESILDLHSVNLLPTEET